MLVKNWMTKNVITIDEDESMHTAIKLMNENNIRRLPVVKRGKLTGIVTNLDINRESASKATSLAMNELNYLIDKIKIKDIMTKKNLQTISLSDTIEEAAVIMLEKKIGVLPVVEDGKLVGIITESDIFKVLISMTGVRRGGVQFAFELEDKPGSIKEVADILRSRGGRVMSIMTSYEQAKEGFRHVYIRVGNLDKKEFDSLKNELKDFNLLYVTLGK
ncbi:MAG: CBS and ACT domain-containing protein [Thermodesulfobacteriota bacterium]|nr:CBS and ACT domain-containing protein [Thermodesulfobacteriota bacterium]